jgi:hypothetical protein
MQQMISIKSKLIIFITLFPSLLFVLYSQKDFKRLNENYSSLSKEKKDLYLEYEQLKKQKSSDSLYEMASANLIEAQAYKLKAEQALDLALQTEKRNKEYRDRMLQDLKNKTGEVEKYITAFVKNLHIDYVKVDLLYSVAPKKIKELENAINDCINLLPETTKENDIEFGNAFKKANVVLKDAKNKL